MIQLPHVFNMITKARLRRLIARLLKKVVNMGLCRIFDFILLIFFSAGVMGQHDGYSESYQEDESFTVRTCPTDLPERWKVSDTTSAMSLAEAINCSGGTFDVTWQGSVYLDVTIVIPTGTTLYVTGEGSGAEVNGGGNTRLFMAEGGNLHIDGLNITSGNATYGGAIAATRSVVFLNQTVFKDNFASTYGGAIYLGMNSTLSCEGRTILQGNTANLGGGAVAVRMNSIFSCIGQTYFYSNKVGDREGVGGALYVDYHSRVSWSGSTSFDSNTAAYGGALCIYITSTASWYGKTDFIDNMASTDGGGIYVNYDSVISWAGETSFIRNDADSFGGAIYLSSSNITLGGKTIFDNNGAYDDGGAVYAYVGYNNEIPLYFIVEEMSTVIFQENTCGANGGAIAFVNDVVTRFRSNVTFVGNTGGAAGGAIYMWDVSIGILFEGARFFFNSAAIGGGIYTTSSGTAVTEDINGNHEYNPTTLIECEFIGNTATNTGGAMHSSAGIDLIVNTDFISNTASIGGALRLVGTTSLMGCVFVENLSSEEEGPGISNDGTISDISSCIFSNDAFYCNPGYFMMFNESDALFDTVCKGCGVQCRGCTIEGKEPNSCSEALEHSIAVGINATLESLLIEPGYWRATKTSTEILACYNPEACLGGVAGAEGFCLSGHEGPYCSVCSEGYTGGSGFACKTCPDHANEGIALAAFGFLLAFIAFLSYMLSGKRRESDRGIVAHVTWFIPLQSVKLVIVVWQILTQFSTVANVVFPSVYQRFLDVVAILNFDFSWVLSAECIIDTDFHDQLLFVTLGPLVCMAILGGTYVTAMCINFNSEEVRGIVRRKHLSMVLLLTFFVYSTVSLTLFKTFACDKLDIDKNYLRADYRIECDSSKHKAFEFYAAFMVFIYVIGIPAFYGLLLYKNRETLSRNAGREEDESIKPITDLWKPYRPDRFYYEIIECIRRVLLTGVLISVYPNNAAQIVVALMMATFFIFVSEALAPYASPWDTWCSRMGHAIVFTSMVLALMLKIDNSEERASSQRVFESVLIAAHSCLIMAVVVETVIMVVAFRREEREDAEPRAFPSVYWC